MLETKRYSENVFFSELSIFFGKALYIRNSILLSEPFRIVAYINRRRNSTEKSKKYNNNKLCPSNSQQILHEHIIDEDPNKHT